jgi:prophage regulatory protein
MLKTRAGDLVEGGSGRARRIIRRRQLPAFTGLGLSTIYEMISRNDFPRPIPLSAKAVGWCEDELLAWQDARIAERDTGRAA